MVEQVQLAVGDTARVTFKLTYTVGKATQITVRAVPYDYWFGVLNRVGENAGTKIVNLPAALTPTDITETVDFTINSSNAGPYGLLLEVLDTNYQVRIDDAMYIEGGGGGGSDMMSMMSMVMVMMMMGMMMPMFMGGEGE